MIDFRYHIVSIIAVFLALALGLFLGSTTLQSTVTNNLKHQADTVTNDNSKLRSTNGALSSALNEEKGATAALEPYAVSGQLTGETVAVVSAPNVDGGTHDKLLSTLAEAGATVTVDLTLQPSYLDPTQDQTLGLLASQIAHGTTLPAGSGTTQASALLARILADRPARRAPTRLKVNTTLQTFAQGKYIKYQVTAQTARPADLVVMLLPAASSNASPTVAQAQNAILMILAGDLRSASVGTVVAGPTTASGGDDGALAAIRANSTLASTLSTVELNPSANAGDPAVGRISVVLALAQALNHTFGSYGLSFRPPVPTPAATP